MNPALSYKEKDGRTPMHWAARNGNIELMQYFMDKGVDIEIK